MAGAALFLLVELMERSRQVELGPDQLDDGREALPDFLAPLRHQPRRLRTGDLIGRAIPAALATGRGLHGLRHPHRGGPATAVRLYRQAGHALGVEEVGSVSGWLLFAGLIGAGLLAVTALVRVGMRHFWITDNRPAPRLRVAEALPIALLLGAAIGMVVMAEPVLGYTRAAAEALHDPVRYIDAVMGARVRSPGAGSRTVLFKNGCLRPGCRWGCSAAGCCSTAACPSGRC